MDINMAMAYRIYGIDSKYRFVYRANITCYEVHVLASAVISAFDVYQVNNYLLSLSTEKLLCTGK